MRLRAARPAEYRWAPGPSVGADLPKGIEGILPAVPVVVRRAVAVLTVDAPRMTVELLEHRISPLQSPSVSPAAGGPRERYNTESCIDRTPWQAFARVYPPRI